MPRLFVAIDTPAPLAQGLLQTLPAHRGIRATPAMQLHLTLRFLGEQDDDTTARIAQALRSVEMAAMSLQVHGVGRFRGRQGAILWAGLTDSADSQQLLALVDAISKVLEREGIAPEHRRFWPHLTLARCRPGVPEPVLREWIESCRTLTSPKWHVDRFALIESFLHAEGAKHVVREIYVCH